MFVFSCSAFTTARFRLTYHPDTSAPDAESNEGGDVISMIVDVKGDTVTKVTIPYLNKSPYLRCPRGNTDTAQFANGVLQLSLVNRIIDVDPTIADSSIQLSVWVASGDDIDLAVPTQPDEPSTTLSKAGRPTVSIPKPEGDVLDVFKAKFPPIIKAENKVLKSYCTSESELSIKTYLHRYMFTGFSNAGQNFAPSDLYPGYSSTSLFQPVWDWFRFRRGSMRFRFSRIAEAANPYDRVKVGYTYYTDSVAGDPNALTNYQSMILSCDSPMETHHFVTIPYNSTARFAKTGPSAANRSITLVTPFYTSFLNDAYVSFAAGDDICLGGLATSPTAVPG